MSDESKKPETKAAAPVAAKAGLAGPIKVKATAPGFTDRYIDTGVEFEIESLEKLGSWMAPVDPAHQGAFDEHRKKVAAEKADRLAKAAAKAKASAAEKA